MSDDNLRYHVEHCASTRGEHVAIPMMPYELRMVLDEIAALKAENERLKVDAARLDWLDAQNLPRRFGWRVDKAPFGNTSITGIMRGTTPIREAIDAALKEQGNG